MPELVTKMSWGNVLQSASLLVTVTLTLALVWYKGDATYSAVASIKAVTHDLEIRAAANDTRLVDVEDDVSEIKLAQKETNNLLLELVRQGERNTWVP